MKIFSTKLVNDELYKKNGEEVRVLEVHENGINATVEFKDGTVAKVYTSEIITSHNGENIGG